MTLFPNAFPRTHELYSAWISVSSQSTSFRDLAKRLFDPPHNEPLLLSFVDFLHTQDSLYYKAPPPPKQEDEEDEVVVNPNKQYRDCASHIRHIATSLQHLSVLEHLKQKGFE